MKLLLQVLVAILFLHFELAAGSGSSSSSSSSSSSNSAEDAKKNPTVRNSSVSDTKVVVCCEWDVKLLYCPYGSFIKIEKAFYGRDSKETCASETNTYRTDCSARFANSIVKRKCQYKSRCRLVEVDNWFKTDPCYKTWKYLRVSYSCETFSL